MLKTTFGLAHHTLWEYDFRALMVVLWLKSRRDSVVMPVHFEIFLGFLKNTRKIPNLHPENP